jgi:NADH dehydrogenase
MDHHRAGEPAVSDLMDSIVIIGGGAGGLELACKLGRKLGRDRVTLVDHAFYHIWKPSLHEVAAGTMDLHKEGLPYTMLAHHNDFTFVYGSFAGLDTENSEITISAVEEDSGDVIIPQRRLRYSKLCIAVGSTSHYFNTPGAAEYTISLNGPSDAERFRREMIKQMTWAENDKEQNPDAGVDVLIIGGGATGVELAAELREASNKYIDYGFRRLDATKDIRITLLEGAPRILPPLPEKVAATATALLEERHVRVVAGCRVAKIVSGEVHDSAGHIYSYDVCVWAAGIKAPAFLATLGLPVNAAGQLEVTSTLKVKGSGNIYAFGDCAACTLEDGRRVPPRAQAAHQQADYLYRAFLRQLRTGQAPSEPYVYRDYGSLVSVGSRTSVGTLMGSLKGRSWFVRGGLARLMYVSLHLLHHRAVLGWMRTVGLAMARSLIRRNTALVKLH